MSSTLSADRAPLRSTGGLQAEPPEVRGPQELTRPTCVLSLTLKILAWKEQSRGRYPPESQVETA